jgi:cation transport regulator
LPPYLTNSELPAQIRADLPPSLQVVFRYAFNLSWRCHSDMPNREEIALAAAWEAVTSRHYRVGEEWYPKAAIQTGAGAPTATVSPHLQPHLHR